MSAILTKGWMAAAIVFAFVAPAAAGGKGACAHCDSCAATKKVCRWVPEKKTIEVEKWDCECETICIPGRSQLCAKCRTYDCNCEKHVERIWSPTCAKARTIKKLKKVKEKKEVCTWKWVVEEVCDDCACKCGEIRAEAGIETSMEAAAETPTNAPAERPSEKHADKERVAERKSSRR